MPRIASKSKMSDKTAEYHQEIEAADMDDQSSDEEEQGSSLITSDEHSAVHHENKVTQNLLSSSSNYSPIARISTFNKVRKRPQCKVCGEYGHYKTRCNLNPDKGQGRRRRIPLLVRDNGKSVITPTILGITSSTGAVVNYNEDSHGYDEPLMIPSQTTFETTSKPPVSSTSMDTDGICKYVSLAHFKDDVWEARYNALVKYGEENGHCNVPYTYRCEMPDGTTVSLGQWLQDQRKEKRYSNLRPDRAERLQVLVDAGLLEWRPTRYDEKKWMIRFEAVVNYATENGNVDIPVGTDFLLPDGTKIDLAKWFSSEITELRSGRLNTKREQLIHDSLVVPGYLQEESLTLRARPRKVAPDDPLWQSKYEALIAYAEAHNGDFNVPRTFSFVDQNGKEILLGWWLHYQRTEHRKRALRKDREDKLNALIESGFRWDASFHSTQWDKRYDALLRFYEEFKTCNVPHSYKFRDDDGTIVSLGRWLEKQRRSKKLRNMPADREAKLQALVDEGKLYWEIYDAERRSRSWQDKYNLLVAYGDMNGSCELPDNAVITTVDENGHTKKVQLGHWLMIQKAAKAMNKLESDRIALIDKLVAEGKMTWDVDLETVPVSEVRTNSAGQPASYPEDSDDDLAYDASYQTSANAAPLPLVDGSRGRGRRARTEDEDDEDDDVPDEDEPDDDVMFAKTGRGKKRRKA